MTTRFLNWLRRTRTTTSLRPARRSSVLGLERLDDRLAPVVGAFSVPNPTNVFQFLDGVVEITRDGQPHCSGTLLTSGRHILTAAHCLGDNLDPQAYAVKFHLNPARAGEATRTVTVPVASFVAHPDYELGSATSLGESDLAVITLAALAPSGPADGFSSPTTWYGAGARRFDLYRDADEAGKPILIAGYGDTGTGAAGSNPNSPSVKRTGNNRFDATAAPLNDEVQVVQVTGATGGTYRLSVGGVFTAPIARNATAAVVQTALDAVVGVGNVSVQTGPASPGFWFVRFKGSIAGQNVAPLGLDKSGLTGPATTNVFERVNGGTIPAPDNWLVSDFDDGTANHDAFGLLHGLPSLGQGSLEAVGANGDSGGPALIGSQVAGVISNGLTFGQFPDLDNAVNFTFGEFELFTRVSEHADWIDGILAAKHKLVIDMNDQVYEGFGSGTVTARKSGSNLEVVVDGDVIHTVPLSQVTGLRIEGKAFSETFTIGSGLGIPVEVVGNGGQDDTLIGPDDTNAWQISPGTDYVPNDGDIPHVTGSVDSTVTFRHMVYLRGGSGADTFKFDPTTQAANDPMLFGINGGGGFDTLDYSNATIGVTASLGSGNATWVFSVFPSLPNSGVSGLENVTGGSGGDSLIGDEGPNILVGGDGGDTLRGVGGRDLLIGGTGADTLHGGDDDDLLIAGRTVYDASPTALAAIRDAWTSPNTYQRRIDTLRNGVGPGGSVALTAATVIHDTSTDTLRGSGGLDWFWAAPFPQPQWDNVVDLTLGEQVN